MNAGICGASVSELHNGFETLLSLSKVKMDVAKHDMTGGGYCCIQPAPS